MRRLPSTLQLATFAKIYRVVSRGGLTGEWTPDLNFLMLVETEEEARQADELRKAGVHNVAAVICDELELGDIVLPRPEKNEVMVLYRESDLHHSVFVTNRCNSYCLMCSQPPTQYDDPWLLEEAEQIVRHIKRSPLSLGITGGEPLLLGKSLRRLIDAIVDHHPSTSIDVLTNGRLFSEESVAQEVLHDLNANISWMIPLYGHADFLHDYVVQSHGAFAETLDGLLTLQEYGQPVQLRIVLIKPVLEQLEGLCNFIGRNLPFVREVALMACEPIGFALANREQCNVDIAEWQETLLKAAKALERHRVPYLLMNAPLCGLPQTLWPAARRSISDWKNTYATACEGCAVKSSCSGLFKWYVKGWTPTTINPIET